VSEDAVFLTTAYASPQDAYAQHLLKYGSWLCAGLLVVLGAWFAAKAWPTAPGEQGGDWARAGLAAFVVGTVLAAALALVGERLVEMDRWGMRRWAFSGLVVSACVVLSALRVPARGSWGPWMVLGALVYSAMVAVGVPGKPEAEGPAPLSRHAAVMLAVAMLPTLVAIVLAAISWRKSLLQQAPAEGALATPKRRKRNIFLLLGAMLLGGLGAAILVQQVLVHSLYLRGCLDHMAWGALAGWSVAAIFSAVCILLVIVLAGIEVVRRNRRRAGSLPGAFRATALVLGVFSFVSLNHAPVRDELIRAVVCVDRANGTVRWIREVLRAPRGELGEGNSAATPTPVIDGRRAYAYFGTPGLVCLDYQGNVQWTSTDLPCGSVYGAAASPILCDGRIIVAMDGTRSGYIAAIDAPTGQLLWRTPRPLPCWRSESSRTPLIVGVRGRRVILVWGRQDLTAYDPVSGQPAWSLSIPHLGGDRVASAVSDEARVYLAGKEMVMALALDRLGTSEDPILWRLEMPGPNIPSPLALDGLLLLVADSGAVRCLDGRDGAALWRARLPGVYCASPMAAGNQVYLCNTAGRTTILAAGREYQQISVNDLRETVYASSVAVDGELFIRTARHLYCVRHP
jgi:outer membrane protein assembly factor BamB